MALVATASLPQSLRSRFVTAGAAAGVTLSVLLALSGGDDQTWRTTLLTSEAATVVGLSGACAWLLVGLLDLGSGRWDQASLVGVSVSGLALFASNRWLVPGLIFWMCAALAVAVGIRTEGAGGWAGLAAALSDAAVVAVLVVHGIDRGEWGMPAPLSGWELYVVLGAAALRSGAFPGVGPFELTRYRAALAPVVIGGSFALLLRVGARAEPWAGVALLVVALAVAGWTVAQRDPARAAVASWPIALCLGAAYVAPGVVPGAAAAALVIATLVVLWPLSPGRGRAERGLVLTFAPATAGFVVIVGAARAAFAHAVGAEGETASLAWTVAAALLPVTLAAGVVVGVRVARQSEPRGYEPAAVVGTWVVFAAAIVLGLAIRAVLGISAEVLGPPERVLGLLVVALAAAALAAYLAGRTRTPLPAHGRGDVFRLEVTTGWPRAARVASTTAPAITALALGATLWLAYEGLREGFL